MLQISSNVQYLFSAYFYRPSMPMAMGAVQGHIVKRGLDWTGLVKRGLDSDQSRSQSMPVREQAYSGNEIGLRLVKRGLDSTISKTRTGLC